MSFSLKNKLIKLLFPLFFSFFIIFLSFNDVAWLSFWGFLNVPSALPPFFDLDSINQFLSSKQQGFDPYFENPNNESVNFVYMYPSIWLHIYEFLNLQNFINFNIFSFIILYSYFYILIDFALRINNRNFNILLVIFFLSTSNFLILERLNVEIIVFCLTYFSIVNKRFLAQCLLFIFSFILKIFPIFSIFIFINQKKYFFLILIFSLIYLYFLKEEIYLMRNNMIEYALIFAYGVGSISKAIYYYSVKFGYFINDNNYFIFRNIMVLLTSIYAISIFSIKFKFKNKKIYESISIKEKFFIAGAGIYIGTFTTSANIDYRLIFLLFTIPLILEKDNKNLIIVYCLSLILCFNSLIIEGGDSYSLIYLIKGFLVYLLKFLIYTINCYYFGEVLNKFINVKFFN